MNDNLKLWANALRVGSHTPNNSDALISFDANGLPSYSALGVGCNTYRQTTRHGEWVRGGLFSSPGYHPAPIMPPAVRKWYGLSETPSLLGKTFAEAADILDPPTA